MSNASDNASSANVISSASAAANAGSAVATEHADVATARHGPTSPCPIKGAATLLAVVGCFALFLLLVSLAYLPKKPGKERGPFDEDGIRTPAERLEKLAELRANEAAAAHSYAWLDQSAGQVQLPIERAMELIVQRHSADKSPSRGSQN